MMKTLFKLMVVIFATCLTSCEEWTRTVTITYTGSCSDDLREFVTPTITCLDGDLNEQTPLTTLGTWHKTISNKEKNDDYSFTPLEFYAEVKYEKKSVFPDTTGREFKIYHHIDAAVSSVVYNDDEQQFEDSKSGTLNLGYDLLINGGAMEKYIDYLVTNPEKVVIKIDSKGKIVKENNSLLLLNK